MSVKLGRGVPLVYATRSALEEAERLLPAGSVLENLVEQAIRRQDVYGGNFAGYVFLDEFGVACRFRRIPGRERERPRAWLVTGIERKRTGARRVGGSSFPPVPQRAGESSFRSVAATSGHP